MWCVKCQVAFSRNTGLRVTGVVHNPHYYEWRRNGGQVIRNAGELHCGGIPDFRRYESKIYKDKEVPNGVIYGFPSNISKDNIREYIVSSTYTTYQKMLEDIRVNDGYTVAGATEDEQGFTLDLEEITTISGDNETRTIFAKFKSSPNIR